jgi:trans-2,3-dihydro-3-hydroxyanthranilate isomerase
VSTGVRLRYRVVDVFSDRPLAGNALCVVLDPVPEGAMAAIAREMNLSETTFPVQTAPDAYDVRIFTPAAELPFAGHPSLGTAWVLGPNTWAQTSPGATVQVTADADGAVMTQPDPAFDWLGDHPAEELRRALGVSTSEGACRAEAAGNAHLVVPTAAPIDGLQPDLAAIARATTELAATTCAVVRRIDDSHLHVRVFVPGAGIAEDPGTGSAAGPVALLSRQLWGMTPDVRIRQGDEMGRPCRIEVHAELGALRVGGRVTACAEGTFTL